MPWSGSGTYTLPVTTVTPAVGSTIIDSADFNTFTADIQGALSLCLTEDGQNPPTANLPMASYRHTGVADATALTHYPSANQVVDNTLQYCGASAAGNDTYAVTATISPGVYSAGNRFQFLADVANAGACTLNVSGIGAKSIKLLSGSDPANNDILADQIVDVEYDGTNFQLLNTGTVLAHTHDLSEITDSGDLAALDTVSATEIDSDAVTSIKILNDNVTADELNVTGDGTAGQPLVSDGDGSMSWGALQIQSTIVTAVDTGTTVLPFDDNIPQNNEGDEFMTVAITPQSASSNLHISISLAVSVASGFQTSAALFVDSTANALAAGSIDSAGHGLDMMRIQLEHVVASGSTASRTYKVRAGSSGSTTLTLNGVGGVRRFGGVCVSSIVVTEI